MCQASRPGKIGESWNDEETLPAAAAAASLYSALNVWILCLWSQSNLASFREGQVFDLPIEVVESQPRMWMLLLLWSHGHNLHDGSASREIEDVRVRYMGTGASAKRLSHWMNVKRIISIIFSFEVISCPPNGTSFYQPPNRSQVLIITIFSFSNLLKNEHAWRHFGPGSYLTLFPNKLHIGDYLEDKIFYCPIGINCWSVLSLDNVVMSYIILHDWMSA